MRYLVIRTDVRPVQPGGTRDERQRPERRRLVRRAGDLPAAQRLARALAATTSVRTGRQRVKIVVMLAGPLGDPPGRAGRHGQPP